MRYLSLVFILLPCSAFAQPPAKYSEAIKSLESIIERERADGDIPSISIAIVEDQTTIYTQAFGHADLAKTRKATPAGVYRVGSITKLFTDIAMMQLVQIGRLDLDQPITKYLPDFRATGKGAEKITLRMLMAHRSGLVRESPVGNYVDTSSPNLADTIRSLNEVRVVNEPGTKTQHSNAGIALVGRLLEIYDGRAYLVSVRTRVLDPVGMPGSDMKPSKKVKDSLVEAAMWSLHGREFPAPVFEKGQSPAGCLYATAPDLAAFASWLMNDGMPIMKPGVLASMLKEQYPATDPTRSYGLGFRLAKFDGHEYYGHGGAIYGYSSRFAVLPKHKLAVVVLASKDGISAVTTRIEEAALRLLLAAKNGQPLPTFLEPKSLTRELARRFAGKYGDHEFIEASGRLYHLPPGGGPLSEVRQQGSKLVVSGLMGNGMEVKFDGRTLAIPRGEKDERFERVPEVAPEETPKKFVGLIGEYGGDHSVLHVFEKDGKLHIQLYWHLLYPLNQVGTEQFEFESDRSLLAGEQVRFERDKNGQGTLAKVGQISFRRRNLDGEDGKTFRIKPIRAVEELRTEAALAKPPEEKGEFRKTDLVELVALDPTIKTELRYASENNFLGVPLYPSNAKAFMQKPAAEAFLKAHQALAAKGYGLWVFDSYRPWSVTKMFWDATPDKFHNFVADPSKGSRHNRGCAVDLTLYELKTGKPVEMVSGYDEFSDRAYPNYWGGTSKQRWHRELLRRTMEDAGFSVYEAEWWHFDFKDWRSYRIGNQDFDSLNR